MSNSFVIIDKPRAPDLMGTCVVTKAGRMIERCEGKDSVHSERVMNDLFSL